MLRFHARRVLDAEFALDLTAETFARACEPLLTPPQAAALLAVRTSWVYEAAREGRLPHLHVGRHLHFDRSELAAWVREQRARRVVPTS